MRIETETMKITHLKNILLRWVGFAFAAFTASPGSVAKACQLLKVINDLLPADRIQ